MDENNNPCLGVLTVDLHIPLSESLKSKRRVLKSMKDRIRSGFNVSVAEIGALDKWQRSVVGVCMIGNDKVEIERNLHYVLSLVEGVHEIDLLSHRIELL